MLSRGLTGFGRHWGAIVLALFLSLLVSAPLLAFPLVERETYQGINIPHFDRTDSHFYLSRAKEVLEGHSLGNIVIKEGKGQTDPYFNYSEQILIPFYWLGLDNQIDVTNVYLVMNLVGVFALVLLIYFGMLKLAGSRLLALVSAAFVVGGYHLVYTRSFLYNDFNFYGRPMYPYLSSLAFFLFFNLLLKSFRSPVIKYQIYSGLAFGLLFYISFYGWSFTLALNLILISLFMLKRDFLNTKKVFFITALGLFLGGYNLYKLASFNRSEIGIQVARFFLAIPSHHLVFSNLGFISLGAFVLFWLKRRNDQNLLFILALILTGWVALNQQILTGILIQHGHYYWYFIVPLTILALLYILWNLIGQRSFRRPLFIILLIMIFVHGGVGQYRSFFTTVEAKKYEQSYRPLVDALNRANHPSVILGPINRLGLLFTIYTDSDLLWNQVAVWSYNEPARFKDALYLYAYLNKHARSDFSGYLKRSLGSKKAEADEVVSIYDKLQTLGLGNVADLDLGFSQINSPDGVAKLLRKYGVSYLVWDKNIDPDWDLVAVPGLKEVTRSGNIYLYAVVL